MFSVDQSNISLLFRNSEKFLCYLEPFHIPHFFTTISSILSIAWYCFYQYKKLFRSLLLELRPICFTTVFDESHSWASITDTTYSSAPHLNTSSYFSCRRHILRYKPDAFTKSILEQPQQSLTSDLHITFSKCCAISELGEEISAIT